MLRTLTPQFGQDRAEPGLLDVAVLAVVLGAGVCRRRAGQVPGMGLLRYAGRGALAGAAGGMALDAVTYLDMAVRGRAASSTPQDSAQRLAGLAGLQVPGDEETRRNRLDGIGPLLGTGTGVGIGVLLGLLRAVGLRPRGALGAALAGGAVMAATDGAMTALGVTDPRRWDASSWLSDAIPHLAYGAVVVVALEALDPR